MTPTKSVAQQEPVQPDEVGGAKSDAGASAGEDSPVKSGFRKTSVGKLSIQRSLKCMFLLDKFWPM